jgi:hypothetical protein
MRMLDLFCGRWGWGRVFAARGWDVVGFDLTMPPEIPARCSFVQQDILELTLDRGFLDFWEPDFICASSPCEQFSVHGMKMFFPNPPYPELGIKLFNHTRAICEASGLPYVMENVRTAQQFVGQSVHHCGPFHLWGTGVPPLMPQGIVKGIRLGGSGSGYGGKGYPIFTREEKRAMRKSDPMLWSSSKSPERKEATAKAATIPPELANCVVDYAERLVEVVA